MSRQGKKLIELPKGIELKVNKEREIIVKGPKGSLVQKLVDGIDIAVEENVASIKSDDKILDNGAMQGLYRSLVANMVEGVTKGFEKRLQLIGTGYRAQAQGNKLDLKVGYSHPTILDVPDELKVEVDKAGLIIVSGINKQLVGQFAAQIRAMRPPEPYKGKEFVIKASTYVKRLVNQRSLNRRVRKWKVQ